MKPYNKLKLVLLNLIISFLKATLVVALLLSIVSLVTSSSAYLILIIISIPFTIAFATPGIFLIAFPATVFLYFKNIKNRLIWLSTGALCGYISNPFLYVDSQNGFSTIATVVGLTTASYLHRKLYIENNLTKENHQLNKKTAI